MLYTEIKEFRQTCRRVARQSNTAKVRAQCLTTLIGEIENIVIGSSTNTITDDLVLEVIRKFVKNINITIENFNGEPTTLLLEKETLEQFLPEKLTELELETCIKMIIAMADETVNIGVVMKSLNADYNGLFDGKLAKEIILREL